MVTADLGRQPTLRGNKKAVSLITGIIDGTGSVGTSTFQLITGATFQAYGWKTGYFLVIAIVMTIPIISLSILFYQEVREYRMQQRIISDFAKKDEKKDSVEEVDGPIE